MDVTLGHAPTDRPKRYTLDRKEYHQNSSTTFVETFIVETFLNSSENFVRNQ